MSVAVDKAKINLARQRKKDDEILAELAQEISKQIHIAEKLVPNKQQNSSLICQLKNIYYNLIKISNSQFL